MQPGRAQRPNAARGQRQNVAQLRVLPSALSSQPSLPTRYVQDANGKRRKASWPAETVAWWKSWASSPLSNEWGETDWSFMLDTALLHAAYWSGDLKVAPELRLRVAKMGATPEDRLRLKITFEAADAAEAQGKERRAGGARSSRAKKGADPRQLLA